MMQRHTTGRRRTVRSTVMLMTAAGAAATAASARAATDNWTNAAGGTWTTGTNWSLAAPPAVTDNAVFNVSGAASTAYTVTLPGSENAERRSPCRTTRSRSPAAAF